ncbi:unnamed protein product [Owenia fusiformis]|uniref:Filamin n=1 Tax=Owenia fusiformis TaxID=6347 RepID=A0A8S4NUG3_OWEFU|nr:unnamed protein product [Owenia fusiformis]
MIVGLYLTSHLCCCVEIPVGKQVDFDIITVGAGKAGVQVNIHTPSGKTIFANIEETIDGYAAKFTPLETGPHTVDVSFAGQPVKGSPFSTTAIPDPSKAKPLPKADPSKVKAYGPGLEGGTTDKPAEFTIDTREAGQGGLGLTLEGPIEAKIECQDNGDGTCSVRYYPTEPGEYTINITFADKPIKSSPFKAKIVSSKNIDVSGIKCHGQGIEPGNHMHEE